MKKLNLRRLLIVGLLAFMANVTMAQTYTYPVQEKQGFSVNQKTRDGMRINYELGSFTLSQLNYRGEEMSEIEIQGIVLPNTEGCPNLPTESRLMAIPQGSTATLNVVHVDRQVIKNVNIAPALRIQNENEEPEMDYKKDMKVYNNNAYYPENPFEVSSSYIRGVDAVTVSITPFQYNPVTKELVVFTNVELSLSYEGGNGHFGEDRLRSPYWDPILAAELMNYDQLPVIDYEARMQQWLRDGAEGAEYIIITPNNDAWASYAEQLKEFRMKQGIITEVYRIDEMPATTTAQMKTWFHDAYDNWEIAPVAVCLFGDHNTNMSQGIPAETTSHPYSGSCITDNFYADAAGNDNLPDMVFSRLVAQNEAELPIFVSKQIDYETAPNMDSDFYQSPITALGWQTERWFQLCSEVFGGYMRNHGYTPQRINCIYDGTPGNSWSSAQNTSQVVNYFGPSGQNYIPATPSEMGGWTGGSPQQVVDAVNAGTFWVQHRDHGLDEGWGEPAVRNNHVDQMNNVGKLPFVMSINCETGMFNYTGSNGNCFTEKWMRRTYNGENAGAVGVLSPTEVSYSFVNDAFVWGVYDLFDGDFMPTYGPFQPAAPMTGNWMPAFGNVAGKYFLAQSSWPYNVDSKNITYTMFTAHCDAFLRIFTQVPQTMPVNHMDVQLAGLDQFQITAPEGAEIALTKGEGANLEIVAVAQATGSAQNITIVPQVPPTVLHLTVTGQNYLRYEADIEVIPASGPYIIINEYELSNAASQLNFGEDAGFDIQLKNVGNSLASAGTATLTTDSEYVTITNGTFNFSSIASNATETINNAFAFTVSDAVPNRTNIEFVVTITSGSDSYESHITVKAYAPIFEIGNVSITEINGNGNGRLDPGETVTLSFPVKNKGNADSWATDATLVINNPFMQLTSEPTVTMNTIAADATTNVEYTIYVGAAPSGFAANYTLNVASGVYTDTRDFMSKIGLNVEDFESGELDPSMWANHAAYPWTFCTDEPYEGNYCLKSGSIGNSSETYVVMTYDVAENDSIAFYYKVSSESGYDKMHFYIDNQEKDNWSGSIGWSRAQYAVTAGTHTFKWSYGKDTSVTSGSDCCWLDFVILPADRSLAVSAGIDMEICEGESAQLAGFVNNQTSMEWSTAGDGTFNDVTIPDAIYTPGTQDIANGGVTLTITASQGTETMSDDMTVSFRDAVSLEMPQGNDALACMGIINVAEYYIAHNADNVVVTSSGDGIFERDVYTFGEQDIANGSVTLTITAYGCGEASAEITVGYQGVPTISGIEEVNTCSLTPVEIILNNESNWCSMAGWTTAGTGTFSDPLSETTIYTPSEADFNNGSVVLTAEYKDCQETSYYHNVTVIFTEIATPSTPVGPTDVYNMEAVTEYSVEANLMYDSYEWVLEPATAGTMTPNSNTVSIAWNMDQPDTEVQLYVIGHSEMCGDSEPSQSLVISLTGHGVNEISAAEINIHPNPTNDIVNVSIENLTSDVQITIYNSVGQAVYTQNESVENGLNTVINLGDLSNGTYILQVRSEEGIWMKRIIKR
ncbi:MAG: T9SS type A sorting domain-containing protein [Bacteroidales bacterium]|nr:T9SS type A sorting domain-containing protein [Bacteroidales bacterium]